MFKQPCHRISADSFQRKDYFPCAAIKSGKKTPMQNPMLSSAIDFPARFNSLDSCSPQLLQLYI